MTQSFNNRTGQLFGTDYAGQVADLNQAVVDRTKTYLGERPFNPTYGSLMPEYPGLPAEVVLESIDVILRQDSRIGSVDYIVSDEAVRIRVNGQADAVLPADDTAALESPVYLALRKAVDDAFAGGYDLRRLLSWDEMPIQGVRNFFEWWDLPVHTELLGEEFERELGKNWWEFVSRRNTYGALNLWTRLAGMSYQVVSTTNNTLRLCFTPPPTRATGFDRPMEDKMLEVVTFLITRFAGNITVEVCINSLATATFATWSRTPVTRMQAN